MEEKFIYYERCEECKSKLIAQRAWRQLDMNERYELRSKGFARKGVRGLCATHYGMVLTRSKRG